MEKVLYKEAASQILKEVHCFPSALLKKTAAEQTFLVWYKKSLYQHKLKYKFSSSTLRPSEFYIFFPGFILNLEALTERKTEL